MGALGIGIIVVLGIIFFIFIWYFSTYNGIKTSDLKVTEALSGIDVALTKRYDVLTKMLDTVKGYMSYEKQTLAEIVRLRSGMTMGERIEANKNMDNVRRDINILAEQYPELRSSNNFVELQRSIVDVEEHLQASRRLYNANVRNNLNGSVQDAMAPINSMQSNLQSMVKGLNMPTYNAHLGIANQFNRMNDPENLFSGIASNSFIRK